MPTKNTTGERGLYLPLMLNHVAAQKRKHIVKEAAFYGSLFLIMLIPAFIILAIISR